MSTVTSHRHQPDTRSPAISLARLIRVELRKMLDTRSGLWLLASIAVFGVVATAGTLLLADDTGASYYSFAEAIGFPMTVLLPIIAALAVTSEWTQRSGLTTFTLVPHRHRVIAAKLVASLAVGVGAMLFALTVGALGNLLGASVAGGGAPVWDVSLLHGIEIVAGSLLCLLTGTMLGILLRSSAVALAAYFVYTLVLPILLDVLASRQAWFEDVRPWVDLNLAESWLFAGTVAGEQWMQLAVAVAVWLLLPGLVGLRLVLRAEVR